MRARNLWPEITDRATAVAAAKQGYQASFVVGTLDGAIGLATSFTGPLMGLDASALIDGVFMFIVGWRIMRLSRAWAVVGLAYWVSNLLYQLASEPAPAIGLVALMLLMAFINGVRGTFQLRKFIADTPATQPATAVIGSSSLG